MTPRVFLRLTDDQCDSGEESVDQDIGWSPTSPWLMLQPEFVSILGPSPQFRLVVANDSFPFAHEAGAVDINTGDVYFTSNQVTLNGRKTVFIGRLFMQNFFCTGETGAVVQWQWQIVNPVPEISAANGGIFYVFEGRPGVVFCQQGQDDGGPSGLVHMELGDSNYVCRTVVSSFYGKPFNSPNDVAVLELDQTLWFTDPNYGHVQQLKSQTPQLPNLVYCYNPHNKSVRVVASGFEKPNGIAFSADSKRCYISDTGAYVGVDGRVDNNAASAIYVFDVVGSPEPLVGYHLENQRVFAFTDTAAPDGLKCDWKGNVYAGCLDGIHIWNPAGILLGKIQVCGGIANFCFTKHNTLILLGEHKIYEVVLSGL